MSKGKESLEYMWEFLPEMAQVSLKRAVERNRRKEMAEHTSSIRNCPRCGDGKTVDCHDVKEIGDATVGLCVTCGYLWCLECDASLITSVTCGHWNVCAGCGETKGSFGDCGSVARECPHIRSWLARNHPTV
jgi:hypothetical protein